LELSLRFELGEQQVTQGAASKLLLTCFACSGILFLCKEGEISNFVADFLSQDLPS
jgi:hypothetical protein